MTPRRRSTEGRLLTRDELVAELAHEGAARDLAVFAWWCLRHGRYARAESAARLAADACVGVRVRVDLLKAADLVRDFTRTLDVTTFDEAEALLRDLTDGGR